MLVLFFQWLGDYIGVPVSLDLEYTKYYSGRFGDSETDSEYTNFGLCTVIITFMLAIRVGMTINAQSISADVGREGNLRFTCWLFGLSVLAILMALIDLAFKDTYSHLADTANIVLQFSAAGGVWWSVKSFYDKQLEKLRKG
jgi:hypothetical protein